MSRLLLDDWHLRSRQERASALGSAMFGHIKRWWFAWAIPVVFVGLFGSYFEIAFNISSSLPGRVYLIKEWDKDIRRGDIVSFRWHGAGPYGAGMPFLKQVIGLPGDVVTVDGRDMYVNGEKVSTAKEYSTRGVPLAVGMTGVIPEGRFYVHAPNPNSLDSRYLLTGWVPQEAVLGKAVLLF